MVQLTTLICSNEILKYIVANMFWMCVWVWILQMPSVVSKFFSNMFLFYYVSSNASRRITPMRRFD